MSAFLKSDCQVNDIPRPKESIHKTMGSTISLPRVLNLKLCHGAITALLMTSKSGKQSDLRITKEKPLYS